MPRKKPRLRIPAVEDYPEFGEMTQHETQRMGHCLASFPADARPAIRELIRQERKRVGLPLITIIGFVLSAISLILKLWQAGLLMESIKLIHKWDELWPEE